MPTPLHGDKSIDKHFMDLTEEAQDFLWRFDRLTGQIQDVINGKALGKITHMYFLNQSKLRIERAQTVFSQLVARIKLMLRVRK